jgi:hypothetical protein
MFCPWIRAALAKRWSLTNSERKGDEETLKERQPLLHPPATQAGALLYPSLPLLVSVSVHWRATASGDAHQISYLAKIQVDVKCENPKKIDETISLKSIMYL